MGKSTIRPGHGKPGAHARWQARPSPTLVDPAPHRIALVEDHAVMREVFAILLGFEPDFDLSTAVRSAEEAIQQGVWEQCDVLITDVSLPGMDGIALAAHVRAERQELPIVVVSASTNEAHLRRAEAAGVQAYLSKADLGDTLAPMLREVLGA